MNLIARYEEGSEQGGHTRRWRVYHGPLEIGCIDEHLAGPPKGTFSWLINFTTRPSSNIGGNRATFDEAKAEMKKAWEDWMDWAGLQTKKAAEQ